MNCIFCKNNSNSSRSFEHIIPESLGNKSHILEPGIVCDSCNQYFAIKLEKVLLETPYFKEVRHRNFIENKKQKIPISKGIIGGEVVVKKDKNQNTSVIIEDERVFRGIQEGKIKNMIVEYHEQPGREDKILSRFLAKVAIETLAKRLYPNTGWNELITETPELDPLIHFCRYGYKPLEWQYHQRRLYNETDRFYNLEVSNRPYEVLHEYDLVHLQPDQVYLVLIMFGIEYAINFTNPNIDGYQSWLAQNNFRSPIISDGERQTIKGSRFHF